MKHETRCELRKCMRVSALLVGAAASIASISLWLLMSRCVVDSPAHAIEQSAIEQPSESVVGHKAELIRRLQAWADCCADR